MSARDVPNKDDAHPEIKVETVLLFERDNGDRFVVDKTLDKCRRAAHKAGGSGIMHRVIAHMEEVPEQSDPSPQHEFRLYKDDIEWFMEIDLPDDDGDGAEIAGFEDIDAMRRYRDDDPDDNGYKPDPDFEEERDEDEGSEEAFISFERVDKGVKPKR